MYKKALFLMIFLISQVFAELPDFPKFRGLGQESNAACDSKMVQNFFFNIEKNIKDGLLMVAADECNTKGDCSMMKEIELFKLAFKDYRAIDDAEYDLVLGSTLCAVNVGATIPNPNAPEMSMTFNLDLQYVVGPEKDGMIPIDLDLHQIVSTFETLK